MVIFASIVNKIRDILAEEQYATKSRASDTIKINTKTRESYQKLARFMLDNNIINYTCQPKIETAYSAVIKYLHQSIDNNDIKEEIKLRHQVRNIVKTK